MKGIDYLEILRVAGKAKAKLKKMCRCTFKYWGSMESRSDVSHVNFLRIKHFYQPLFYRLD